MKTSSPVSPRIGSSFIVCLLGIATSLLIFGCQAASTGQSTAQGARLGKPGAQLWAESCNRCHNYRSPGSYSDAQWSVAMHHMRIRANLTAEEEKEILAFLKSSN